MYLNKNIKNKINSVKEAIKKRFIDTKNHRIYIQDSELLKTDFKPGEKYNFEFDKDNGSTLKIFIDSNGKRIVSKRKRKDYINPVIDIRTKDILEQFKNYDKVEIEIFENEILVRGLSEQNKNSSEASELNVLKNKVIKLESKLKVENEVILSKKYINDLYLKRVVNGFDPAPEQLSFDSFLKTSNLSEISISSKYSVESVEKHNGNINTALRLVSLFSGCGGLDKGFIDQGFKAQRAIDIEADMVKTYKHNLGNHVIQADLTTYDINNIPDAECLIGGTPCQDFSNANRKTGKKVLDSPKNQLIRKYIAIAKKMKSLKVFVLENVPQLITKGKVFLQELIEELSDFEITVNKVNSSDFGSAQSRERVIIIGSKIGKIELKKPIVKLYNTVRQSFQGLTDKTPNQLDYSKPKPETLLKMSFVPPGGNFKNIPEEYRGNGCHSNLFRRLEWDKKSITIANPRKSNILHPEKNRILSVRECARLFDLPDSFEFLGRLSNKQQMIANSVPGKLATAIAKTIKIAFEKFNNHNNLIAV